MRFVFTTPLIAAVALGCTTARDPAPAAREPDRPTTDVPPPTQTPTIDAGGDAAPPVAQRSSGYVLEAEHTGASFFDGFDFEDIADPTHGTVDYVDESTARGLGLVSVDAKGHARIAVENETVATNGRKSVRLRSKKSYEQGLFVIDVDHLPEGNGVWPAFWTVGAKWPAGGEIDIIEGVSNQPTNASTLHTKASCSMAGVDQTATMTGHYTERDCNAGDKATGMPYIGCGVTGPQGSFGPAFNAGGGGVFAMKWTAEAIDVWAWTRARIPDDIAGGATPTPESWGLPVAHFALGTECTPDHFGPQQMILNTTLCGDWAGNVFVGQDGKRGPDACRAYVLNHPTAFDNAFWDVAYIRTFVWKP